jgi:uncharacterized surface protein with fasciclin (FAS1) repeats
MRKTLFETAGRKIVFPVVVLAALAMFSVSCEKEEADVTPRNAEVTSTDIVADVSEAPTTGELLMRGPGANKPGDMTITAIATGSDDFEELVDALLYVDEELDAGLVALFSNMDVQYTVFAPNDAAFDALYGVLGIETIRDLDAELVLDVLLYHVTNGRRASNSVLPPMQPKRIQTLLGEYFEVSKDAEIEAIGSTATIIAADISASNGIIHGINAVLLPIVVE